MKAKIIKTGEMVDVYHEPQHGQITNIYKECVLVNGRMWTEDELNFCMKANEAPEKIYIPTILVANTVRYKEEGSIEYVRTDAFIEKAWDFIEDNLLSSNQQDESRLYYEQFKNYMKGE